MKINRLLILFLAVVSFQSCKKTIYNEITDDEMKWLAYQKGDIFVFADTVKVDTFYVSQRIAGYSVDKPYYNEGAQVTFINYSDTLPGYLYGNILVSKNNDNECTASFEFPHFPYKVILTAITPVPTLNINGVDYTNVYIAEADSVYYSSMNYLKKIYYNKEEGFLVLEDIYGGVHYKIN
jgi:hypothetical protein